MCLGAHGRELDYQSLNGIGSRTKLGHLHVHLTSRSCFGCIAELRELRVANNAAGDLGFVADRRRLNVAVTRARRHVCVVCDPATISSDPLLASLVELVSDSSAWMQTETDAKEDMRGVVTPSLDASSSAAQEA